MDGDEFSAASNNTIAFFSARSNDSFLRVLLFKRFLMIVFDCPIKVLDVDIVARNLKTTLNLV